LKTDNFPLVELDPKGIFRCLLNLISNGLDAFEGKERGDIWITLTENDQQIEISIRDNGVGMDKDTQNKLFTKFFSTKGSSGSGIGLPVTKKIIDEHRGTIDIESHLNEGTTFIITLPIKKK